MDALIGKRICQARKAKHLTQEKLSELSGLSVSAISRIETGRNSTSLKTLKHLCDVLDVTLNYMLYDVLPQQALSSGSVSSDIMALLDQLDESQQNYILEMIRLYIAHLN